MANSLKNLKIKLPDGWREASRSGTDKQIRLRIYHTNSLYGTDPKIFSDQVVSSSLNSQVVKIGVGTPSGAGGSFADYFKAMDAFVASGFAPADMTSASLDDLHKRLSQTPGAEVPDESDMASDVSIVKYDNEQDAEQALVNYGSPTAVLDGPIPGAGGKSIADIMQGGALKGYVSEEQLKKMKEMASIIKEKMPQMKEEIKKSGLQYKKGKFLGYDAIFSEIPNPVVAPKSAAPVPKGKFQGGGSRGNNLVIPLPKITKPHLKTITFLQAVRVNNFVVTGGLLPAISALPTGDTPCYSLTKTEQRTDNVEGVKSTYIIPAVSAFAQEGYLCKEDAEKAFKTILTSLDKI